MEYYNYIILRNSFRTLSSLHSSSGDALNSPSNAIDCSKMFSIITNAMEQAIASMLWGASEIPIGFFSCLLKFLCVIQWSSQDRILVNVCPVDYPCHATVFCVSQTDSLWHMIKHRGNTYTVTNFYWPWLLLMFYLWEGNDSPNNLLCLYQLKLFP